MIRCSVLLLVLLLSTELIAGGLPADIDFTKKDDEIYGVEVRLGFTEKGARYPEVTEKVFNFCLRDSERGNVGVVVFQLLDGTQMSKVIAFGKNEKDGWFKYEFSIMQNYLDRGGDLSLLFFDETEKAYGYATTIELQSLVAFKDLGRYRVGSEEFDCSSAKELSALLIKRAEFPKLVQ